MEWFQNTLEQLVRRLPFTRTDNAAAVQVKGPGGRALEGLRLLPFGFSSRPAVGMKALVLLARGAQAVPVVLGEDSVPAQALAEGEALLYAGGGASVHLKANGDVVVQPGTGGKVHLGGEQAMPAAGVVTGECVCAFTGSPHPQFSASVRANKEE